MKRVLLTLTILAVLWPGWQEAKAGDTGFDFFYNNLSGGSWFEVGDYGYCWQPDIAVGNPNWRPYADGYWAYTDVGWTWISYEDFGWATYHYGRWAHLTDLGWVWVPGKDQDLEWGPAWVSWRTGGEYVGWAPLPPSGEPIDEGGAITGEVDFEFNIGPACYNFVDLRYFGEPVLRERIVEPSLNVTCIIQTVNVTNITYKNKVVCNYGPDINVINAHSHRPVQRLRFERQENLDASNAGRPGELTKVQGDRLVVGVPAHISKPVQQIAPPAVKTKVARANLDTGWSAVGDAAAQEQFKRRLRSQNRSNVPPAAAASAGGQVGILPAASPSSTAPAATGNSATQFQKGAHVNQLGQQIPPNAAGNFPAGALSPAAPATGIPVRPVGQGDNDRNKALPGTYAQPGATAPADRQRQGPSPGALHPDARRSEGGRGNRNEASPVPSPQ